MLERPYASTDNNTAEATDDGHRSSASPPRAGSCSGRGLLETLRAGAAWLEANVQAVNALNVFPVPDGDTGTNMVLTLRAALKEAELLHDDAVGRIARVIADGALMAARGNSGVILSQILRGLARTLDGHSRVDAMSLAQGLEEGAATAYKGVMKPVEGTILTVAKEAAAAARQAAEEGKPLEDVLAAATAEAYASVQRTPQLLPILAEAGVVDAGGQGFLIILEGALKHVRGEIVSAEAQSAATIERGHIPTGKYNYDTQFVIKGHGLQLERIRQYMATIGDSVLVVGDGDTVKVHVHCDNPAQALDFGLKQGALANVFIENMQLQHEAFMAEQQAAAHPAQPTTKGWQQPTTSVIAVASGDGLRAVFENLGASAIVHGGQTMNPSTQDLLGAIEAVPSQKVFLLPNNPNIFLAASQAKELSTKDVIVLPTRTVPQGISALLAFDPKASFEANAETMEQASHLVQTVEITRAVRSVRINGLCVQEGQFIGLLNDDLKTAGDDLYEVVAGLLQRAGAEQSELLTIYYGDDVSAEEAKQLADRISCDYPNLDTEVLEGGQAYYCYIISLE